MCIRDREKGKEARDSTDGLTSVNKAPTPTPAPATAIVTATASTANTSSSNAVSTAITVDERTACFLRDFPIEWLKSDKQVLGVRVEASSAICREFLKSRVVDAEVLLNDE